MKKRFAIISSTAAATLLFSTLLGINTKKIHQVDAFDPEEGAYFCGEITDEAGYIKANKYVVPTDNKYSSQKTRSLGSNLIGDIESVWDKYTGKGTTVAIIDDGFDHCHPEYTRSDGSSAILSTSRYYYAGSSGAYYKKYSDDKDCIAEDWEEDEDSWATHGTNTSTTAAAPMGNNGGVGIAPEADILALKIDMSFAAINAAVQYAVSQNVDVINMSLGAYAESFTDGFGESQSGSSSVATYMNSACKAAYDAGIIVIAAAGNEATWHKSYPACNSHVIGVGALGDYTNKGSTGLAEFTNYVGSSQTGEINVDILAPGYVYTATQSGSSSSSHTHIYDDTQGTSFSSPIVAGAACLWKQKNPSGTPDQFLSELQSTADGIGTYNNNYVPVSGWYSYLSDVGPSNIANGRLNISNLLLSNPSVVVEQDSLSIVTSETKQIKLKSYNGDITYSSSDNSVATVSSTGLVTGVSKGDAEITVTATLESKSATAKVNVKVSELVAATSLTFNPDTVSINEGETYASEPTITVTPSDATRAFLFESENESVATVDEDTGVITAVAEGTAKINAIAVYGTGDDSLTVTVNPSPSKTGTISFGSGTGRVNINSSSVSGTDSLSNSWTITTTGTTSFNPSSDYSQIGSSKNPASSIQFSLSLSSSVSFSNVSASFGGNSGTAGSVTIKVGDTTIGSGSLVAGEDVVIKSTSQAKGNNLVIGITSISKGVKAYSISYTTGTPSVVTDVVVSPSSLNLDFKTSKTGSLTAVVNGTGSPDQGVTWSSSDESVAIVSNVGLVTAVGGGSATISATSTYDTSKKGTCSVTVTDEVASISVTNEKTYHPGDKIVSSDIEVNKVYDSGKKEAVTDFTFASENYQFTYDDAPSGGSTGSKKFSVTYQSKDYDFNVSVSRIAYVAPSSASKSLSSNEFKNSTLSKSSSTASASQVTIGGISFTVTTNAYAYNKSGTYYLSFGKNAGSIQNTEALSSDLTAVEVTVLSGSRTDGTLEISKDNVTWVTYTEAKVSEGGYLYLRYSFASSSSLYSNIKTIAFETSGADTPTNVANYIMYEDTVNQCSTKLDEAIAKLNTMSDADKATFVSSSDYVIATSRERLEAWARHEGKELIFEDNIFSFANVSSGLQIVSSETNIIVCGLVILLSFTAIVSLVVIRKKKSYKN